MSTIADRIIAVRGKMRQADFAEKIGINTNTLRNYENGRALPNQKVLESICVHFSVNSSWLLLGAGSIYVSDQHPKKIPQTPSPEELAEVSEETDVQLEKSSDQLVRTYTESLIERLLFERPGRKDEEGELKEITATLIKTQRELIDTQKEKLALQEELLKMYKLMAAQPVTNMVQYDPSLSQSAQQPGNSLPSEKSLRAQPPKI